VSGHLDPALADQASRHTNDWISSYRFAIVAERPLKSTSFHALRPSLLQTIPIAPSSRSVGYRTDSDDE
jgi:hypothetical protein